VRGRIRQALTVPMFSLVDLDLSSLVLAPIEHNAALPDREAALRGMPEDLSFHTGTPLAAYVEIYGLGWTAAIGPAIRCVTGFAPLRSTFARCSAERRGLWFLSSSAARSSARHRNGW